MKKICFSVTLFFLVILSLEISLHVLSFASFRIDQIFVLPWDPSPIPRTIPDSRLGYRPNPDFPYYDRNGFRNPEVPSQVDIVALGDSQTYGTGVKLQEAWPQQLAKLLNQPVYTMAYGGYGPIQSLILWDEATELSPRVIIEAIYSGNDLFDIFSIVYQKGQFTELKTPDLNWQAEVIRTEEESPFSEQESRHIFSRRATALKTSGGLYHRVGQYSKLFGLVRRMRYELLKRRTNPWDKAVAEAAKHAPYTEVFQSGTFRTVFTSHHRLSALDLTDPRIIEGQRIMFRALLRMRDQAEQQGIQFMVALIPTKELVFSHLASNPSDVYSRLLKNEAEFWQNTIVFLTQHEIDFVNTLVPLQKSLDDGIQPYQVSHDGHLNEKGHRAIAEYVLDALPR